MPLTEDMRYKIRDTSHLLDIIDAINGKGIPDEIILVSFDIVIMLPSTDNVKEMDGVRLALKETQTNKRQERQETQTNHELNVY